jgi:hypothetical protein
MPEPSTKVPLVRVAPQESLRDPGGDLDSIYQLHGVRHLEAWQYAAFLHQLIQSSSESEEAIGR